jgi:hypothetical protein
MRSHTGKNTNPRFDLDRNPPYQINYRAKRCGKTITASKRRITFQFGFSSASAIASGKTAVDCRGEEHEVVLIWSHMSGKRELFMDGRQVHTSKGNSEFMYSWALGNHILKITASGVGEAKSRQFDLELDGMSYFTFKQIYQLGDASGVRRLALPPSTTTTATRPKPTESMMYKYVGTAVDDDDDEDEYVDETPPTSEVRAPVIDLFEHDLFDSQPPTQISFPTTPFNAMHYQVAPPPPPQVFDSTLPIRRTVSNNNSMGAMSSYDEFAPVPVASVTPRFDTSQILGAYDNTNSNTYTYEPSQAMVPVKEESNSSMDFMTKSLVNLDDIMSPMISSSTTTTPRSSVMSNTQNKRFGGTGMAPTLSEMNSAFGGSITTPIMNSPPAPTMMYQQQQQQQQQGFYQQQGGQQQGYSHHMGQPQAMMSPIYGYNNNNYSQQQPQQYGYAPAY